MNQEHVNEMAIPTQIAINVEEVQEAARTLAKYDLGICLIHMHDPKTGELMPLPSGMIACERERKVSFEMATSVEAGMVPVGWRWTVSGLEVCASCCAGPHGPTG